MNAPRLWSALFWIAAILLVMLAYRHFGAALITQIVHDESSVSNFNHPDARNDPGNPVGDTDVAPPPRRK